MSDPKPNCESMFDGKVRAWTKGVPFDEKAQEQVGRVASLPFVQPVAIMPDVHWGMGATIGSVIPTLGAIRTRNAGLGDSGTRHPRPAWRGVVRSCFCETPQDGLKHPSAVGPKSNT